MEITNLNIVMLMLQPSVVVRGLEKDLVAQKNNVRSVIGDFSEIDDYMDSTDIFILNLPGKISEEDKEVKTLMHLCSRISAHRKALIVVGEKEVCNILGRIFPGILHYPHVFRPVVMNAISEAIDTALSSRPHRKNVKRILIVDDDPDYAKVVRSWIKDEYRVDIVTAGMKAITFLLKVPEDEGVDLILLDYEMPVVDGPQVLQMLRQDSATSKIPVVFLTGVGTREEVARVMELKPDGYILKSATREDLMAFLHSKLG